MADNRVVCALSCERRSCVCEERSANEVALPDFKGREDAEERSERERAGRVALRYSAGSKCAGRNGARTASDRCEDLVAGLSSAAATAIAYDACGMEYGDMRSYGRGSWMAEE
jgi:hypothetical protein